MTTAKRDANDIPRLLPGSELTNFPPADRWDDWEEYDAKAWPTKVKKQVRYVPTTCFNCESACGLLAVIDKALPDAIRTQLAADLPGFMHYFADRMGALPERPMLFASYDIRPTNGFGRQGGTLPGQVFVHFYGEAWPKEMAKPGFAGDLAWHFAHEAGHLYQHQVYATGEQSAWVHEGGAEAFGGGVVLALGAGNAQRAAQQHQ